VNNDTNRKEELPAGLPGMQAPDPNHPRSGSTIKSNIKQAEDPHESPPKPNIQKRNSDSSNYDEENN